MSFLPNIWNWPDHYKGSTLSPSNIRFNFDITGAIITCTIRAIQGSSAIYEWKTDINITVVDLVTGEVHLNQINKFSPAVGNYICYVKVDFANGESETYIKCNLKVEI